MGALDMAGGAASGSRRLREDMPGEERVWPLLRRAVLTKLRVHGRETGERGEAERLRGKGEAKGAFPA